MDDMSTNYKNTAVIIPCYNEEATVKKVIDDFKKSLPGAAIYVFNNNSSDKTAAIARKAGALVRDVKLRGKGNVVRRMFADIDADTYVMVDGDATYDAPSAPVMVNMLLDQGLDMVVGCREEESSDNNNYRPGHRLGNMLLTGFVQKIFNGQFTDMLSGYRVFSKRFVKSFTADSHGFETETELTVHALEMRLPYGEVSTPYGERPEGSVSKLSTYKDGIRIVKMIVQLYSNERPKEFWGLIGGVLLVVAIILVIPVFIEFLNTHLILRMPTLVVATSLGILSFLSFTIGLVLRTVTKGRREMKHLMYLQVKAPTKNA
jgi:glycosyltransferase involved in cell wall biosynthesis